MNMKKLFGEIEFSPEYNYKSLRKSKTLNSDKDFKYMATIIPSLKIS